MPDLHDLLAAEAERRRSVDRPEFADLVRRWTNVRRRRFIGGFTALAVVAVLLGSGVLLGSANTPTPNVPRPSADGSSDLVTVTGVLRVVGGVAISISHGVPGTVTFVGPTGGRFTAAAGSDGRFTIVVPVGRYIVTGTSPLYNDGKAACRAFSPVIVEGPRIPAVAVECVEK